MEPPKRLIGTGASIERETTELKLGRELGIVFDLQRPAVRVDRQPRQRSVCGRARIRAEIEKVASE
jgi:hypothetical protein